MHEQVSTRLRGNDIEIMLPGSAEHKPQGDEWLMVRVSHGDWQRVHFHDYTTIFSIPGLYEYLFHDILKCQSPTVVGDLLGKQLRQAGVQADQLRVLDLGAGNGLMGDELTALGVALTVGVDICPAAAHAAERDRPGVYGEYRVLDLARPTNELRRTLAGHKFNALTCVSALGFADISPPAFRQAYNILIPESWVALTFKEEYLTQDDGTGSARLIREMSDTGVVEILESHRYLHRLGSGGEEYHYVALIGRKARNI